LKRPLTLHNDKFECTTQFLYSIGGPQTPQMQTCLFGFEQDNVYYSDIFLEGFCSYSDVTIENLGDVLEIKRCQTACGLTPGCQYFIHNLIDGTCVLKSGPKRLCFIAFGPRIQ
jgi:hypothetical protein